MVKIRSLEITPESAYLTRRRFMVGLGATVGAGGLLAACADPQAPVGWRQQRLNGGRRHHRLRELVGESLDIDLLVAHVWLVVR